MGGGEEEAGRERGGPQAARSTISGQHHLLLAVARHSATAQRLAWGQSPSPGWGTERRAGMDSGEFSPVTRDHLL